MQTERALEGRLQQRRRERDGGILGRIDVAVAHPQPQVQAGIAAPVPELDLLDQVVVKLLTHRLFFRGAGELPGVPVPDGEAGVDRDLCAGVRLRAQLAEIEDLGVPRLDQPERHRRRAGRTRRPPAAAPAGRRSGRRLPARRPRRRLGPHRPPSRGPREPTGPPDPIRVRARPLTPRLGPRGPVPSVTAGRHSCCPR